MKKYVSVLVCLFLLSAGLFSDADGQALDPDRWYRIVTPGFEIIFPGAIEDSAQYAANLLEATIDAVYSRVNGQKLRRRKWSVVLSNTDFIPNGYVTLAPRYSRWYGLPAYDFIGGIEWYAMLASHEGRHMAQFDDLNAGFVSFLRLFLGDYGEAVGINGALPRWYFEGDAVLNETLLSKEGRGRSGAFKSDMAALLLGEYDSAQEEFTITADGRPSLPQMINRSYERYIPSRYELGFHLVNFIRKTYGDEAWNRIAANATQLPIPNLGLTLAIRKETGKSLTELYADMEQELAALWSAEYRALLPGAKGSPFPAWHIVLPHGDSYTRYGGKGISSSGDSLYVSRYDMDTGTRIYEADPTTGSQREIFRNPTPMEGVSFGGDSAVWISRVADAVDPSTGYGEISVLDIPSGKASAITRHGRYYRASLSPDGRTIAALSFSLNRRPSVEVFEKNEDGWHVLRQLSVPEGTEVAEIAAAAGNRFLATVQEATGMGVYELLLDGNGAAVWKPLIKDVTWQLGPAVEAGDGVYLSGDIKGIPGIWKIDNGKLSLVTPGAYGARLPLFAGDRMYFSNHYSPSGEMVAAVNLADIRPVPYGRVIDISENFLFRKTGEEPLPELAISPEALAEIPRQTWPVEKYPLVLRIPNYHSRVPMFDFGTQQLSLILISDDILGTTSMQTTGQYSFETGEWRAGQHLEFTQLFPRISLGADVNGTGTGDPEPSGYFQLRFPFAFSREKWQRNVSVSLLAEPEITDDADGFRVPFTYSAIGSAVTYEGFRSYQPYLGFSLAGSFEHAPFSSADEYRMKGSGTLYLPGGVRHGGFNVRAAAAYSTGEFIARSLYLPGFAAVAAPFTATVSAAWDIPIAYPDFNFFHLLFTKRRRLGFYGDAGWLAADPSFRVFSQSPDISCRIGLTDNLTVLNMEYLELAVSYGAGYAFGGYSRFDPDNLFPWLQISYMVAN